jgi:hypothetical protein
MGGIVQTAASSKVMSSFGGSTARFSLDGGQRRRSTRQYNSIDLDRRTTAILTAVSETPRAAPPDACADDDDDNSESPGVQTGIEHILPRLGDILGAKVVLMAESFSESGELAEEDTSVHGEWRPSSAYASGVGTASPTAAAAALAQAANPRTSLLSVQHVAYGDLAADFGGRRESPSDLERSGGADVNKVSLRLGGESRMRSILSLNSDNDNGLSGGDTKIAGLLQQSAAARCPSPGGGDEWRLMPMTAHEPASPSSPSQQQPAARDGSLQAKATAEAPLGAEDTQSASLVLPTAATAVADDALPKGRASFARQRRGSISGSQYHHPQLHRRGFVQKQLQWLMRIRCEGVRLREFTPGVDLSGFVDAAVCTAIVVSFFIWTSVRCACASTIILGRSVYGSSSCNNAQ